MPITKVLTPENITCSDCKRLVRSMRPCYSCQDRRCAERHCPPQLVVERVQTCIDFYYQFFNLKKTHKSLSEADKSRIITLILDLLNVTPSTTDVEDKAKAINDKDETTKSDIDYDFNQF